MPSIPSTPVPAHPHLMNSSPSESSHDLHLKWPVSRTDSAHTLTAFSPVNSNTNTHADHYHHDNHDLHHDHHDHHGLHGLHDVDIHEAAAQYLARQEPAWKPVSQRRLDFEARRPSWLRECVAEATGVFIFVFCGISSIASFVLHHGDENGIAPFGSIFQIGWAFCVGVALAIITCAPISGGLFNPAITLAMAFWQDFPWKKVPRYILSQILGAFIAGLMLMACYWTKIQEVSDAFNEAGKSLVGGGAPASILCSMPMANQNMGHVFAVEFFADAFIGLAIWAALDPANPFMKQGAIPFVIGLAYAVMIWGFGSQTLSTNLARDLGPRIVAAMFFGKEAFTQMGYAPIGMLVNIPATLLATAFYELWIRDSFAIIAKGHAQHREGDEGLLRHMRRSGMLDEEKGIHVSLVSPIMEEKQH